ncbi:hypothetical protein [Allonocardiopsis opalescens]|uniref:Uncharacterized protein n=1 Tax=Allonocardiopsis opalescens TaxID=1144618 RepID=A0A2T0Q9T5_9ACTN|nr:hypothetical protein [Allonocardiopsis opalescens]PRY00656.1 hypothetical protein CLV72_102287 [Allonocardiopsis opalescens]
MFSDRDGRYLRTFQRQAAHAHDHCTFLAARLGPLRGWLSAGGRGLSERADHIRRHFEDIEASYQRVTREAERPPPDDRRSRRDQRRELRRIVDEMSRKVDELDSLVLGLEVEHRVQSGRSDRRPPEAGG